MQAEEHEWPEDGEQEAVPPELEEAPEGAASAGGDPEEEPLMLTPEEVVAHLGPPEPPSGEGTAGPDKGLGAVEPLGEGGAWAGGPAAQGEVALPPPEAIRGAPPPGPAPWAPDPAMLRALVVEPERLEALWQQADALHARVKQEVHRLSLARRLFDQIRLARDALLAGPAHFDEAERLLQEVDYRLALIQRVREWSYTVGMRIFFYELTWAVLLGGALFGVTPLVAHWGRWLGYEAVTGGLNGAAWLVIALKSLIWGGLGGVTGALHALWRHIARDQDFDKQYTMWYLTNPIMGVALGAFVYLVMQAGLLSLTAGDVPTITSAAAVFVLAWIAGFQQNVAYDLVRRILRVFRLEEGTEEAPEAPLVPPPPPPR